MKGDGKKKAAVRREIAAQLSEEEAVEIAAFVCALRNATRLTRAMKSAKNKSPLPFDVQEIC